MVVRVRGEVGGDREFVCSPRNGNARWTRNDGKEKRVWRRSPDSCNEKIDQDRASKVVG